MKDRNKGRRRSDREMREAIGGRLRNARKAAGYTLLAAGQQVGVSKQSVSVWEAGLAFPKPEHFSKLVAAYGATADSLLGHDTGENEQLHEAELDLRRVGGQLTPEDLQSIRDFIKSVFDKRQKEVTG